MAVLANKLQALEQLSGLKSFYLPEIPVSLPVKCHPDWLPMCREADAWMFKYMDVKTPKEKKLLVQWRMPLYSPLSIPVGGYDEGVGACKFMWMAAMMDDPIDDDLDQPACREFLKGFLDIGFGIKSLSEVADVDVPEYKAFDDLMADFRRLMLPPVYNRFMQSVKSWSESFYTQSVYTEETYAIHRRNNYFMTTMFQLTEMCLGISVKDEDLEDPDYLNMFRAMTDHGWMVNDVLTIAKDIKKKKFKNLNLVLLLGDPNIHTLQDAVNKTCSRIQENEKEFTYYNEIVMAKAREANNHDFHSYCETLRCLVTGNWYWHYLSARYHGVDNPFMNGDILHGTWLLHPEQTILLPSNDKAKQHPYLLDLC